MSDLTAGGVDSAAVNETVEIKRLGIIAGSGPLPFCILDEAERLGIPVSVAALEEETSRKIEDFTTHLKNEWTLHWMGVGQLGKLLRLFAKEKVDKAIMVGQVKHVRIFAPGSRNPFTQIKQVPDFKMIRLLSSLKQKNTSSLIGGVIAAIEKEGIEFLDSSIFLKHLLAEKGVMTQRSPSEEETKDVAYGHSVAKEIARLDIGQTVAVKQQAIVAVEAMERTDATIRRAAELAAGERLTVVKVSRPHQDMRFDLPVLGLRTLEVAVECNVTAFAIDPGKTLIIDKRQFLERADDLSLTVLGYQADEEN
jgi:DUF1009 family protein